MSAKLSNRKLLFCLMKFQQQKLITVKEKEMNFAETKYGGQTSWWLKGKCLTEAISTRNLQKEKKLVDIFAKLEQVSIETMRILEMWKTLQLKNEWLQLILIFWFTFNLCNEKTQL